VAKKIILLPTAVSRNGEARDLFEIAQVFKLKFCLYLLWLGLGSSPLHEAAGTLCDILENRNANEY
jgi:hypothetical protein